MSLFCSTYVLKLQEFLLNEMNEMNEMKKRTEYLVK